ncbi:YdcF family protein [Dyadobacter flavalbus]|uniref:YdcF family protein n=1 Tax=Dyadobacter flavalbus TaxID=2579942 RepID=A0A5M8QR62_9BACT|nr:YdcF family protein [Dyadobacter flavalbus]KAA6436672.1 YdcF family protein [Dyadobacter flavalbus]
MFYFLSKAVDFLVMPLSIAFFLMLYALFTKKDRRRKRAVLLTVIFFMLISNSYIVNKAFNWWEPRPSNIGSIHQVYDVGILLSGGLIASNDPAEDHAWMGRHGDRVLQTFLLYKSGKIRNILITGTSSEAVMAAGKGETRQAAAMLVKWGVPAHAILYEEKARNTRENALFSARILKEKFASGKYILVTSAFHMRRSAGCFVKAGVKADLFPADFYGNYYGVTLKSAVIPDPDALAYFSLLWHEWVGYVVYSLAGYC